MRTLFNPIMVALLFIYPLQAQNTDIENYFNINPAEIETKDPGIQEYEVSLKWQNLDAINGDIINCNIVNASYFTGLENNCAGWKNVRIAQIEDFNQKLYQSIELPAFNDFSYKVNDTAFLSENFYRKIPAEQRDLAKWLVSDAVQMQGLAWYVFDSLSYNMEFLPGLLDNYEIQFENWVNFTSRYQKLIWSGIGKHNDEICAIVKFESYYNPIKIDNEQMFMKGRAMYYGEIRISLEDKQVEYASMFEDDIFKLQSSFFPDEQFIDLQREVVFNKKNP